MAYTDIQKVRIEVADNEVGLYILADDEIQYLLDKRSGNITNASLDAARIILMKLAQRSDESVDIFSIKGSKAASEYRMALELFIKNPNLNPLINNLKGWVGGVSVSEMQTNDTTLDNNIVQNPTKDRFVYSDDPFSYNWRT